MFKQLALACVGIAAVNAAPEGMDWEEWEWNETIGGMFEESPFKDEHDYSHHGTFSNNGEAKWFNGIYAMDGRFVWSTDWAAGQANGLSWWQYGANPVDLGGRFIFSVELFKWYYHIFQLDAYAMKESVGALKFYWPADLEDFWKDDSGTDDHVKLEYILETKLGQGSFSSYSNWRECRGDLLPDAENAFGALSCAYNYNNQQEWATGSVNWPAGYGSKTWEIFDWELHE